MEMMKQQNEFFIQTLTHYIDFKGDAKKYSTYLNDKVESMKNKEQENGRQGTTKKNPSRK